MNDVNMDAAIIEDTADNAEICDVKICDDERDTSVEIFNGSLSSFLPMNGLTREDLDDIESQINEIVQHAEVLVNSLLIGDAFRIAAEFHELQEHILEAPEEFRTEFDEQGRGDENEASLQQCRQKLFEPERSSAERNHDNGSGPEAVPCGWAAPEEVGTCENETLVDRVNVSTEPQEINEFEPNATDFDDLNHQIDGTNAALKEIQKLFDEELESSPDNPVELEQSNTIDSARDSSFHNTDKIATHEITNGEYAPSDSPFTKTNEHRGGGASGHPKKPELVNDAVNTRPCDTVASAKNTVSSDGDDVKRYGQFDEDIPRESGLISGLKCDLDNELDENELDLRELFEICESLRGVLQSDDYRNRLNKEDNMFSSVNLKTIVEEEDEIVYSGGNNNKLMLNNNVFNLVDELPSDPRVAELPESHEVTAEVSLKNVQANKYDYESYFDSLLSSPTSKSLLEKRSPHHKVQLPDQLSLEAISAKLNDLDLNQVLKYRKFDDLGNNLDKYDEREIQEDAEFEFIEELLRSLEDEDDDKNNKDGTASGDLHMPLETLTEVEASMIEESNIDDICNNGMAIAGVSNDPKNLCESGIETGDVDNMNCGNADLPIECVNTSCNIPLVNDVGTNSTPTSADQSAARQWKSAMVGAKVDRDEFATSERAWGTSEDGGRCDGVACATEKTSTSIRTDGVARGAQPPGCSREPTAKVCTALDTQPTNGAHLQTQQSITLKSDRTDELVKSASAVSNLSWGFRNGRLVFDVPCDQSYSDDESSDVLKSKDLNKKSPEGRLKFLEEKLKEAGITDGKNEEPAIGLQTSSFEDPDSSEEDLIPEDLEDLTTSFCEFDPHTIHKFHDSSNFFEIYDELNQEDEGDEEDEQYEQDEQDHQDDQDEEDEENKQITTMRGDGSMGTNERKQHNPNRDNLKSLLKKPGRNKEKKNRVIFNETKNEFFDADYIILIREECDYDEEDDDGVCTCNQHEMVRLTCCEPNCNCNVYEGYDPTPQSPKFAPPLEFVDAVTLSPPEEYKDMELEEQQLMALQQQMVRRGQRAPVCRECSASHEDEGDGSVSDNEEGGEKAVEDHEEVEEKEKTDQSQQTTPTTPPPNNDTNDEGQRYILETLTMTTVSERQIIKEAEESQKNAQNSISNNLPAGGSPISGILKGGRLWKQTSAEINNARTAEPQQTTDNNITSDDEGNNKRSVRFSEANSNSRQRDVCDGAPEKSPEEEAPPKVEINEEETTATKGGARPNNPTGGNPTAFGSGGGINTTSPESTEMMLTFKLGNHVLISNNSLKPNSAVRQLFPCTKPMAGKPAEETAESHHQYLVTAESLKAFEEAKRSKLPQIIQSGETDDTIRRAIERNTLRRSLIRYEPKSRKATQKTDNSLVERIKQLTCDVDDVDANTNRDPDDPNRQQRASPPGEEARNSPEVHKINHQDKSFSPSSSSTASSNSSSMSSTYKKITDLFAKRDRPDIVEQPKPLHMSSAPDLGNGPQEYPEAAHMVKGNGNQSNEHRKQFLSTLAPLTACVSGMGPVEEYYHMNNHNQGDRTSMASSVGTEYSLEDIDEVLRKDEEDTKKIAPDVLAGTPSASESGDELAMFVQQDAGRIERIKKKYQPETTEDDDEHDDYGFNRRPSVRGIKPRFGSTTEILQQIQNQMQPPSNNTPPRNHVAWPYYSETNLSTNVDNTKPRNINQNGPPPPYPYPNQTAEDIKRAYAAHQYRPTSYIEENIYQNCTDQRCTQQVNYRTNMNVYPPVVRVGGGCSDYYASLPRNRNGRPQSPPPQEVSKNYHQTLVYIPYNHIEGYHPAMPSPNPYYSSADACYARVTNQNQINKRYVEATYQRIEDHYSKPVVRQSYARSESPQISTARSTQTPVPNCAYYPPRYRAMVPNGVVWQEGAYVAKINRHSFPMPRYPPSDSLSLTDSDSQHSNGYRETTFGVQKDSMPNSPTKTRFIERGVPEGAASVSPQDSVTQNSSTMTSPTSPQNPQPQGTKPLFYAMNV